MLTLIFLFDFNIFARRQLREKKIFYNIKTLNTYIVSRTYAVLESYLSPFG
jgi:hypothetical protein